MLDLVEVHGAHPSPESEIHHLVLPNELLLIYSSADSVVLRHAPSFRLVRILAFWEAFPRLVDLQQPITCVSVDPALRLIAAASASRIAFWTLSTVEKGQWRVHSSLDLPHARSVTSLHCLSGLLAVGCASNLHVYTLILENDLPTWSVKWTVVTPTPTRVLFSPSLMCIVTSSSEDTKVRLYSTASGRHMQVLHHPRPVINVNWRTSQTSSRDDLILCTATSDATVRIFIPVLDSPRHMQLHASLDAPAGSSGKSSVTLINGALLAEHVKHALSLPVQEGIKESTTLRRLVDLDREGWDLFLRALSDGSIEVTAVANIDRRPPTLLKQFILMRSPPLYLSAPSHHLQFIASPAPPSSPESINADLLLLTSTPLSIHRVSLPEFFDSQLSGLTALTKALPPHPDVEGKLSKIDRLVRTPDGHGLAVLRTDCVQGWRAGTASSHIFPTCIWERADQFLILEGGAVCISYSPSSQSLRLATSSDRPAVSIAVPAIDRLISLPPSGNLITIFGITGMRTVIHVQLWLSPSPSLVLLGETSLPLDEPPRMILPVDPMAWSASASDLSSHDMLVAVSGEGSLSFWVHDGLDGDTLSWRCTGKVRTGRTELRMARCSSAKKTVLVVPCAEGDELTIWDSKESEFASGLEFRTTYSAPNVINDLDWTATPDSQSILAVGFTHRIELLYQQRMTYFDEGTAWGVCWSINLSSMLPHRISDSVWLAGGSLLVGAGHQLCLFTNDPAANEDGSEGLFEYVARHNGPLEQYHPQMLLQCLLWDKVEVVQDIIVNLAQAVSKRSEDTDDARSVPSLPIERFFKTEHRLPNRAGTRKPQYSLLFDISRPDDSVEDEFSRPIVERLLAELESSPLLHLTPNENAHLLVLIKTALEVDEQRRALDSNGLRYLISIRSFKILNEMASLPTSRGSDGAVPLQQYGRRERLRYRDIVWAFHSQSQDLLLGVSIAACKDQKMLWPDARALGVFLWMTSIESMKNQMEVIARNHYMAGDVRDPEACSLFYFALGKFKLVHGLWRSAAWHKEQTVMLRFLSKDFSEPGSRTVALKNAFALLSKRRFQYAAAFFLLGGSLKDAVNVCLRQLNDLQLAVALARVVEQGDDGPVLQTILKGYVIPLAFKEGNRWLGSWAFWLLKRRDLAVRILITPLSTLAKVVDCDISEIGEPHYDDPSLALLFSQIRSKTLQTVKGTSEISGKTEFNFVLQIARVFCRMGCHVLALDLLRSWTFQSPSLEDLQSDMTKADVLPSPSVRRRPTFTLTHTRRQSVVIDIDMPSNPPTRATSPTSTRLDGIPETIQTQDGGDLPARKVGLGRLIQAAKQEEKAVPEFDIGAFSF